MLGFGKPFLFLGYVHRKYTLAEVPAGIRACFRTNGGLSRAKLQVTT